MDKREMENLRLRLQMEDWPEWKLSAAIFLAQDILRLRANARNEQLLAAIRLAEPSPSHPKD